MSKQLTMWMVPNGGAYEGGPIQLVTIQMVNKQILPVLCNGTVLRPDGNLFRTFAEAKREHVRRSKQRLDEVHLRYKKDKLSAIQNLKEARALKHP